MAQGVQWHGDAFKAQITGAMRARLIRAAMVVQRRMKQLLSVSGTGVRVKAGLSRHGKHLRRVARSKKIAQFVNKFTGAYNKLARKYNKAAKKAGAVQFGTIKKKVRTTKTGKLTTRKARNRKKP